MNHEDLKEVLRLHALWLAGEDGGARANLWDADLRNADLRGANLWGADLWGADLWGADLWNANLGQGPLTSPRVPTWSSTYYAMTFDTANGRWLRYGCETRTLDEWNEQVAALCEQHEPYRADYYESEIRALVALCRVVDLGGWR